MVAIVVRSLIAVLRGRRRRDHRHRDRHHRILHRRHGRHR
jgi:hypothetical protein